MSQRWGAAFRNGVQELPLTPLAPEPKPRAKPRRPGPQPQPNLRGNPGVQGSVSSPRPSGTGQGFCTGRAPVGKVSGAPCPAGRGRDCRGAGRRGRGRIPRLAGEQCWPGQLPRGAQALAHPGAGAQAGASQTWPRPPCSPPRPACLAWGQRSEFRSMAARPAGGCSLLLQPRGLLRSRGLELDVELLEALRQLLLVASEVGGDGVVEKQQLLVHHLDLGARGAGVSPTAPPQPPSAGSRAWPLIWADQRCPATSGLFLS